MEWFISNRCTAQGPRGVVEIENHIDGLASFQITPGGRKKHRKSSHYGSLTLIWAFLYVCPIKHFKCFLIIVLCSFLQHFSLFPVQFPLLSDVWNIDFWQIKANLIISAASNEWVGEAAECIGEWSYSKQSLFYYVSSTEFTYRLLIFMEKAGPRSGPRYCQFQLYFLHLVR